MGLQFCTDKSDSWSIRYRDRDMNMSELWCVGDKDLPILSNLVSPPGVAPWR